VIREHLRRHYIGPQAASYLRGSRYEASKQPNGGDRRSAHAPMTVGGKTAEALAEIFGVSPATIRRDAEVADAVDRIAEARGAEMRPLLLRRDTPLTRGRLLALADLPEKEQRDALFAMDINKRLPRGWRGEGESATITLPREAQAMATALLRRLPSEEIVAVTRHLTAALERFAGTDPEHSRGTG
jgi:hypothetical protein